MTPPNFNWFIHVMLFYHTRNVIKQQENKARREAGQMDDNEDDGSDDGPN